MELYFEMRASAQVGLSSACEQGNEAIAHVGVKGTQTLENMTGRMYRSDLSE